MVRFQVSKYKNTTPVVPKKENCILEIPVCSPSYSFYGNLIASSRYYLAYSTSSNEVAILDINTQGKQNFKVTNRKALHNNDITHMEFSNISQHNLITSSSDNYIKVWKCDQENMDLEEIYSYNCNDKVVLAQFHPTTENIYSYITQEGHVGIGDMNTETPQLVYEIRDRLQSNYTGMSWKSDGSMFIIGNKFGNGIFMDPRQKDSSIVIEYNLKDSISFWVGNTNYVANAGVAQGTSGRYLYLKDIRNPKTTLQSLNIDGGKNTLIPYYDEDTSLLILSSKNENRFYVGEFSDNNEMKLLSSNNFDEKTISFCSTPKKSLDLMNTEVIRLYQLNTNGISPLSYRVPRKSLKEFHNDLYPDTSDNISAQTSIEWFSGSNKQRPLCKLQPNLIEKPTNYKDLDQKIQERETVVNQMFTDRMKNQNSDTETKISTKFVADPNAYSMYRYIEGTPLHDRFNFKNFNQISSTLSSESNGIACVKNILALSIVGSGGKIAILNLSNPGRIPEEGPFFVENGCQVNDIATDPFDESILAAVLENSNINIWKIQNQELTSNRNNPDSILKGLTDRTTLLRYHNCAKNIIASGDVSGQICIWDIESSSSKFHLINQERSQVLSMSWDPTGKFIVSTTISKQFYTFDPRASSKTILAEPCFEGAGPQRVEWIQDQMILASGFKINGQQTMKKIDLRSPKQPLSEISLYPSPAVLVPYYDPDNNMIYVYGKGGVMITPYELRNDQAGFFECQHYLSTQEHQTVAFLRKDAYDVKEVEVARAIRILKNSTEIVPMKVQRVKKEYFQDDLYPDTNEIWKPTMTSKEWLNGGNNAFKKVSLCPKGMEFLSKAQQETTASKYDSAAELKRVQEEKDFENLDV